jgi:hypothetical protein
MAFPDNSTHFSPDPPPSYESPVITAQPGLEENQEEEKKRQQQQAAQANGDSGVTSQTKGAGGVYTG